MHTRMQRGRTVAAIVKRLMKTAVLALTLAGATAALAQQAYYIYPDHLNTPRAIENQAMQLVWRWENRDPFGANLPDENPSSLGNFTCNLRFPGQYYDVETGLHYNYFRDYAPETGRYIQSDPIGLVGGMNTYNYVSNDPVRKQDPLGLQEFGPFGPPPGTPFPSGIEGGMYPQQPINRGLTPYEKCMMDCYAKTIRDQAIITGSIRATGYAGLAAAGATGNVRAALTIQAARQTSSRLVTSYWPVAVSYYGTTWTYKCNSECECVIMR